MKKYLSYLSFLPFVLALLWAAKVYGEKLFASPDTHRLTYTEVENDNSTHQIQVALLLDISGSMSGLIDQAKAKLWQVVNDLSDAHKGESKPNLEIALYVYGGDHLQIENGYVKQLTPLTTDLDLISEKLFELKTNGGEEYCGHAIQAAQMELDWSDKSDDLRMIFVAGNEPFNQGQVPYQQVCKIAAQKDILVNTIFCGPYINGVNSYWKHGADLAKGAYMNIDHNMQSVHIATPFDSEISELNSALNDTYISYRPEGNVMKERQIRQDANANFYGKSNSAKRAIAKSKGAYKNSSWDLVDALKDKKVKLEELNREYLSQKIEYSNTEELEAKIKGLSVKRNEIQQKIVELDKKRKGYITKQKKEKAQDQTLDAAMTKAIRDQAKTKKFSFKE